MSVSSRPLSSATTISSLLAATLLALAAAPAAAQPASAQAETLFRQGKFLIGEGRIAEACTAFDGSYRKDPLVSTLLNLADCREKNHQYASAWGHFLDADRMTRADASQQMLNQTAHDRAARLEARLSYLIINVPDESRVEGLEITRNGQPVDPAEWNRKSPVDGGSYTIEARSPGHEPWSTTIRVADELDRQSVDVPRFKPVVTPPGGSDVVEPGGGGGGTWSGKRKAAVGLGVVGVGAGVGALVFELSARSLYDDSKLEADDAKQRDLVDQANSKRLYAQLAGGVAVVAIGTAAVLWFTGKPEAAERAAMVRPLVSHDRVGFAFTGRF
jgi:hypothetical protein